MRRGEAGASLRCPSSGLVDRAALRLPAVLVLRELGGDGIDRLPVEQREAARLAIQDAGGCRSLVDGARLAKIYVDAVVRDDSCHSIRPTLEGYRVRFREDTLLGITLGTTLVCGGSVHC